MRYFKDRVFDNTFFKLGLITLLIVLFVETCADVFNWYYIFPNLDTPMHILGGMLVGFFALAYTGKHYNLMQKLLWAIAWSLAIGLFVEIVEWSLTHLFRTEIGFLLQPSALDTFTDIIHDFVGGVIAFCIGYFMKRL